MARARSGNKVKTKLGFVIYGEQGTWKSSLCLDFMKFKTEIGRPFRVLYIDAESGSVDSYLDDLEAEGIDIQNIYIVYTQSLSEIREYVHKATNNENYYELDEDGEETENVILDGDGNPFKPDAIVIDGTTIINLASQQGLVEFSKKRASVKADKDSLIGDARFVKIQGAGMELKDYQTLKFDGHDLILDLLASGKHFAVTAREVDEKQTVKTNDGKITSIATGRKMPEGFKDLRYNAKTVLHTFIDDNGTVKAVVENKDRSKVHMQNEIIDNPTLLDWQSVVTNNKDKKDFVLHNSLEDSVVKEEKKYVADAKAIDNKTNNKNDDSESPESYHKKITEAIAKLPVVKKRSLQTEVKKKNLPLDYTKLTDIEKLKVYLEMVS